MSSGLSFGERHRSPASWLAISAVVAVHAGVICGFLQWNIRANTPLEKPPVQVALIAEAVAEQPNLRPPPLKLMTPAVEIAPPVVNLQFAESPPTITVAYRSESMPVAQFQAPLPKMVSTVEYLRPLRPRYPPTSRRLREQGMVVLLVLVDETGKASRIEVRDSSGSQRLDRAAQEAVECALFKPYLENGVPRPALVLIPVEFTLNQRVAQR